MGAAASLLMRKRPSEVPAGYCTTFRARRDGAITSMLTAVFRIIPWTQDPSLLQYACTSPKGMSIDHASAVAAAKADQDFLQVVAA